MNKVVSPEIKEVMDVVNYRPAVSVIMPFEPKMVQKAKLMHSIKMLTAKVEQELYANYPDETVSLVLGKFSNCIRQLNFNTHKNSVAIYVSPVFEKYCTWKFR
ncbi:MAG: hypothetical protein IPP72_15890 [Chitinophagaceae bacterium]|nr:hypothetical protein [Chitinophagaceae bacterium]